MYLNAHISVFINGKPLSSVVSIKGSNDNQHIGSYCELVVPLMAIEKYEEKNNTHLTSQHITESRTSFRIVVKAKYDEYATIKEADSDGFITLFDGYIYDIFLGTPATLKCMDAFYLFNIKPLTIDLCNEPKNKYGKHFISIEKYIRKYLLPEANANVDNEADKIKLDDNIIQFNLVDFTIKDMTAGAILEHIKKEIGINISLIERKLYVQLSSNTTNTVKLSTGTLGNVKKVDLQRPTNLFLNFKIKAWYLEDNGLKNSFELGQSDNAQLRECYFYNVERGNNISITTLQGVKQIPENWYNLAVNALTRFKQLRYNGSIETYLYPICDLFWRVIFTDARYPERNAIYVIIAHNFEIDQNGYRRILKLAYLADTLADAEKLQKEAEAQSK